MAKQKITKRLVDSLNPGDTIFDTEVKGFMVRAWVESKVYGLKYTTTAGRQRIYKIGEHGPFTPDQARVIAQAKRAEVLNGGDPQGKRRADKAKGQTFDAIATQYMDEHAKPTKKSRSIAEDERLLRLHLRPALGTHGIEALTKGDMFALKSRMKDKPVAFNRARALASCIFNFAIERELRTAANPVPFVPEYPEKNRECFLSIEEYSRLFDAMTAIERESGRNCPSPALACVRLLALTGARKSEIQTLKWSFVDLKHGVLRLPDSKTGAKVISLPDAALELLAALPRLSAYVMPGDKDGTTGDDGKPVEAHFVGIQKAWQRIRARAGLGHVRLHDLRHAFASLAAANGESMKLIGAALGHRQSSTTDRYAHLSVDPIRAMVGRTAEKISAVSKAA